MNEFLARLGDRINPIVVKETRQAVNSRLVAAFMDWSRQRLQASTAGAAP